MRADRAKQLLKNGVYRAIGETVSGVGVLDGEEERTLRVLMYHKVNDLWPNPTTVPTALFAEQMALLGELGYVPVSLDAVRDHYLHGAPLPPGAVLITFDDGYRDNLENAVPVLQQHGYPAVVFVPIAFLDDSPLHAGEGPGAPGRLSVFPNPARAGSAAWVEVSASGPVALRVYDVSGREVGRLAPGRLRPGFHRVPIDLPLSPGTYWIRAAGALVDPVRFQRLP